MSCKFSVRNRDDNVCAFSMNKPIAVTCDGEEYNLNWLLEKRDELAEMSSNTDIKMDDRATCDQVANLLTDMLIACNME